MLSTWQFKEECVGTYLRFLAFNSLHLLKSFIQGVGTLVQAPRYRIVFLLIKFVAWIPLTWRIDHQFNKALPNDRRTEHDADELVYLLPNIGEKALQLEISSSVTAFANHAFRDTMQRREFYVVVFAWFC